MDTDSQMQYFLFKCMCFWLLTMGKLYGTLNSPSSTILLQVIVTLRPARRLPSHRSEAWGQRRKGSARVWCLSLPGANEKWWALLVLLWGRDHISRIIGEVASPWPSEGTGSSSHYFLVASERSPAGLQPPELTSPAELECSRESRPRQFSFKRTKMWMADFLIQCSLRFGSPVQ